MAKRKARPVMKWTPAISKLATGAIASNLASVLAGNALGGWAKDHFDKRLDSLEAKLDQAVALMLLGPGHKDPPGFRVPLAGKQPPKRLTPGGMFLRAVLAGVPFTVNGIAYRPVRAKKGKR